MQIYKGASIKDVRTQGVCLARKFCGQGEMGVLQLRTSALFDAKNFGFFEIYSVSVRTRGVDLRIVCGQGEEVNFLQFCANVLYGRPLYDMMIIMITIVLLGQKTLALFLLLKMLSVSIVYES